MSCLVCVCVVQVRTTYTVGPNTKVIRSGAAEEMDSEDGTVTDTDGNAQQLQAFSGEHLNLLPLVNIQHSIAQSIELAHRACVHRPEDADDIKRSAILCRSQLVYTIKLLKKIEQTATSVLDMFPDLELAVEDGEPTLAHGFFNTVKNWVVSGKSSRGVWLDTRVCLMAPDYGVCLSCTGRPTKDGVGGAASEPREHDQAAQDPREGRAATHVCGCDQPGRGGRRCDAGGFRAAFTLPPRLQYDGGDHVERLGDGTE